MKDYVGLEVRIELDRLHAASTTFIAQKHTEVQAWLDEALARELTEENVRAKVAAMVSRAVDDQIRAQVARRVDEVARSAMDSPAVQRAIAGALWIGSTGR